MPVASRMHTLISSEPVNLTSLVPSGFYPEIRSTMHISDAVRICTVVGTMYTQHV